MQSIIFFLAAACLLVSSLLFLRAATIPHDESPSGQDGLPARPRRPHAHDHPAHGHHALSGHLAIDRHAHASRLSHWHAGFKGVLSLATVVFCLVLSHPWVSAVVFFFMLYLAVIAGGVPIGGYLSLLLVPAGFLLLSVGALVVSLVETPSGIVLLSIGDHHLCTSLGQLRMGGELLLRVLAAVSALQFLILTTPASRLLTAMRRLPLPGPLLDLMHLIYRYVFILLDAHGRMQSAAASRLGYRGFLTACRTFGAIAGNLLVVSLRDAQTYYCALEARGYDGELRFLEEPQTLGPGMVAGAVLFLVVLALVRLAAWAGGRACT